MKQQINLLSLLPEDKPNALSAKQILHIAIVLIIALIIFTCFYSWLTNHLKTQVNNAELAKSISKVHITTLKEDHADQFSEEYLSQQLSEISNNVKAKQKIISILSSQKNIPNIEGFSKYFRSLAEHTLPNVWLTSIKISNGGETIKLTGNTLSNDQVLKYLKLLNETSVFQDHPLKLLNLSKEQQVNTFTFYSETAGNI